MSSFGLALEGFGILLVGIVGIIWSIVKILSCFIVAIFIVGKLHLIGMFWWAGVVIIACCIGKIVFLGNKSKSYSELVDNYEEKIIED